MRIAETRDFATAYGKATAEQKAQLILISNVKDMRKWLATASGHPLETLSYRKLREKAKLANVFNYSRLTREELIAALEKLDHARVMESSKKPD